MPKHFAYQRRQKHYENNEHQLEEAQDDIFASLQPMLDFYQGISMMSQSKLINDEETKMRMNIQMKYAISKVDQLMKSNKNISDVIEKYGSLILKDQIQTANSNVSKIQKEGKGGDLHLSDWIDEQQKFEQSIEIMPEVIQQDFKAGTLPTRQDMTYDQDSSVERYIRQYEKKNGILAKDVQNIYRQALLYAKKHDPYYSRLLKKYDVKIETVESKQEIEKQLGEKIKEENIQLQDFIEDAKEAEEEGKVLKPHKLKEIEEYKNLNDYIDQIYDEEVKEFIQKTIMKKKTNNNGDVVYRIVTSKSNKPKQQEEIYRYMWDKFGDTTEADNFALQIARLYNKTDDDYKKVASIFKDSAIQKYNLTKYEQQQMDKLNQMFTQNNIKRTKETKKRQAEQPLPYTQLYQDYQQYIHNLEKKSQQERNKEEEDDSKSIQSKLTQASSKKGKAKKK